MKATIESTDKIVELVIDDVSVPARVWLGRTTDGVAFHCFITRVAVSMDEPAHVHARFRQDLIQQTDPKAADKLPDIPLRLIL